MTNSKVLSQLILNWAASTWGDTAYNPTERAMRMFEEAAETAQAMNLTEEVCSMILTRTFKRPKDDPRKEIGGLLVTVYALCAILDISPSEALATELTRMLSKSKEELRKKHQDKVDAGTATKHPDYSPPRIFGSVIDVCLPCNTAELCFKERRCRMASVQAIQDGPGQPSEENGWEQR